MSKNNSTRSHMLRHIIGYMIGFALIIPVIIRTAIGVNEIDKAAAAHSLTVDPTKPYPYTQIPSMAHYDTSYLNIAPVWVIILLGAFVAFSIVMALLQQQHRKWVIPMIILAISMFIATTAWDNTQIQTDDTYATWAEERYGIEMTDYPTKSSGLFSYKPDNDTSIFIDDKTIVNVKTVVNSDSDKSLILIDSEIDSKDQELEVIAE